MIRELTKNDLDRLNEMACYFNLNISSINNINDYYIGYMCDEKLVAFLSYSIYYERAELNYIFVMEEYRRKKIASKLLEYVLNKISELENITLEVRESNNNAIALYEKFGFKKCTVRRNYYGKENAIMMIKKFGD